jgi:hypothetical protein
LQFEIVAVTCPKPELVMLPWVWKMPRVGQVERFGPHLEPHALGHADLAAPPGSFSGSSMLRFEGNFWVPDEAVSASVEKTSNFQKPNSGPTADADPRVGRLSGQSLCPRGVKLSGM